MPATTKKPPLYHNNGHRLRARLRKLAFEYGPGQKLPTVVQMEEMLGISSATLGRACKQLEEEGIFDCKRGVGIYVSSRLQRHVAYVCNPSLFLGAGGSPFWNLLMQCASEESVRHKTAFSTHFVVPDSDDETLLHPGFREEVLSGRVQGVLAVGLPLGTTDWIQDQDIPVVSFAGPSKHLVINDSSIIINKGVENLVRRGCKRIALWVPVSPSLPIEQSFMYTEVALLQAELSRHKVDFYPELVISGWDLQQGRLEQTHQEQGFHAAMQAFASAGTVPPDGVIITDDTMAQGAFVALYRLGVALEKDLKIVTHSNHKSSTLFGYEDLLVCFENDPAETMQAMFQMLNPLMANRPLASNLTTLLPRLKIGKEVAL